MNGQLYEPREGEQIYGYGSTAVVRRVGTGKVLKSPIRAWWSREPQDEDESLFIQRIKQCFHVEHTILETVGVHPRIVDYLGRSESLDQFGLLFKEASHGDLQWYLDNNTEIPFDLSKKWCLQAAEAVAIIHERGIIHSDIRPDNFLVDVIEGQLELRLCDFGGSTMGKLSGGSLPDAGFFNPNGSWDPIPEVDIFSLGSVIYTILTGYYPHGTRGSYVHRGDAKSTYEALVEDKFSKGIWPEVGHLVYGQTMLRCWKGDFDSARRVCDALVDSGLQ